MMAPAANDIAHDLGETNKTVIALFTSIYVAAYGTSHIYVRLLYSNKTFPDSTRSSDHGAAM